MKTITFYSYKGGVGRSLILANVAKRLTEIGKNVCMLDFDLEAPGLEFKFLDYKSSDKEMGVVDFITNYTEDDTLPQDISKYVSEIHIAHRKHHGWLKLIKAGDIDDDGRYWKKLMSIDWKKLFYTNGSEGFDLILHLKALIEKQIVPDYLLVDSRTGITETSGITLSILADEVVIVAANNDENFLGSLLIMKNLAENTKTIKPKINFVLSRVPFTNSPKDREKEFDKLTELKQNFVDEGILLDDIYVIHSDRKLEEEESLKIGEFEREGEICVNNDYLYFFDKVIKPDLTETDLYEFNNIIKAKRLLEEAISTKDDLLKLNLLNKSIELDNQNKSAYLLRANAYQNIGDIEKAEKDLLAPFLYFVDNSNIDYSRILHFYSYHKQYSKIIDFADTYPLNNIKGSFSSKEVIKAAIANAYVMLGSYDKAHNIYEALLQKTPENLLFNYDMAKLYLHQGEIDKAQQYLEIIIKRNPNYSNAIYTMAIIQALKNNKDDFYIYLDRALESDRGKRIKTKVLTEAEFKKYYKEEAFQRILYKYNVGLNNEE